MTAPTAMPTTTAREAEKYQRSVPVRSPPLHPWSEKTASALDHVRMGHGNHTVVTEFILQGLSHSWELQMFLSALLLLFYVIILPGNFLIIGIIWNDPSLGSPMFFFLANLALLDICYSCVTPPKMMANLFSGRTTISYLQCMLQIFFIHFLGGAEMFLLIAMAIDRYVAICHPLRYTTIVTKCVSWALVVTSWVGGFMHSIIQVILIIQLPFCGPNMLDNFFCDITQIIKRACTNTYMLEFVMFVSSGLVSAACFILLLTSYGALLVKVRMGCSQGKSKASSTCITHIIIVFIMFGPAIYIYCRPFQDFPFDKVVAFFHTVVFPLMNPMIYTLRNKEIKVAMGRLLKKYIIVEGN
ncbi:olfactory receptor 4N5-like [Hemicordylus capensis]|uniref:olfactory receptor 4N5-like n=1 Tax=Hemicordylus capensis TaxID=884348 RepID=UPI002302409A|nr:olfactory receptor 4N5-like [Hemicordylus capensis]XP_053114905.1 olfactory receptor 4N5-like [Hemicordylus capensis]